MTHMHRNRMHCSAVTNAAVLNYDDNVDLRYHYNVFVSFFTVSVEFAKF